MFRNFTNLYYIWFMFKTFHYISLFIIQVFHSSYKKMSLPTHDNSLISIFRSKDFLSNPSNIATVINKILYNNISDNDNNTDKLQARLSQLMQYIAFELIIINNERNAIIGEALPNGFTHVWSPQLITVIDNVLVAFLDNRIDNLTIPNVESITEDWTSHQVVRLVQTRIFGYQYIDVITGRVKTYTKHFKNTCCSPQAARDLMLCYAFETRKELYNKLSNRLNMEFIYATAHVLKAVLTDNMMNIVTYSDGFMNMNTKEIDFKVDNDIDRKYDKEDESMSKDASEASSKSSTKQQKSDNRKRKNKNISKKEEIKYITELLEPYCDEKVHINFETIPQCTDDIIDVFNILGKDNLLIIKGLYESLIKRIYTDINMKFELSACDHLLIGNYISASRIKCADGVKHYKIQSNDINMDNLGQMLLFVYEYIPNYIFYIRLILEDIIKSYHKDNTLVINILIRIIAYFQFAGICKENTKNEFRPDTFTMPNDLLEILLNKKLPEIGEKYYENYNSIFNHIQDLYFNVHDTNKKRNVCSIVPLADP
jgi:hypothetical protein